MILTYGTGTGSSQVVLPGAQYPFLKRTEHQQELGDTGDGTPKVYNHQVNRYFIECAVKVNENQRSSLNSFLHNTVGFAYATFSLTPDAGIDLGSGVGSAVAVRYWPNNYQEQFIAPSRYEISLTFRREAT